MNTDHAFRAPAGLRELTPEEIDTAMRRARLERSRAVHDLLHRAGARIAGWLLPSRASAAPRGCGHAA
jgi:hypothetical protein